MPQACQRLLVPFEQRIASSGPSLAQGVRCPEGLTATGDMGEVVAAAEVILMVIPTPFVERVVAPLAPKLRPDQILVSCTKGILNDTLETPNDVRLTIVNPPLRLHGFLAGLTQPMRQRRVCPTRDARTHRSQNGKHLHASWSDIAHRSAKQKGCVMRSFASFKSPACVMNHGLECQALSEQTAAIITPARVRADPDQSAAAGPPRAPGVPEWAVLRGRGGGGPADLRHHCISG